MLSWPPVRNCVFVLVEFCPEVQISRLCNKNLGAELLKLPQSQKEKRSSSHGLRMPGKCTTFWVNEDILCFPAFKNKPCVFVLVAFVQKLNSVNSVIKILERNPLNGNKHKTNL